MNDSTVQVAGRTYEEVFAARFWSKVDKCGPVPAHAPELGRCWIWTAYVNRSGYGEVGRKFPRRAETAQRVAWELANGGPVGELCALHRCDNRACVNPDHIFLGTRTENMADKVAKGRQLRGERCPVAILTEATVREARRLRSEGVRTSEIARRLGIKYNTLRGVLSRQNWRHVA